jgi:thiamine-monophosphate kinase
VTKIPRRTAKRPTDAGGELSLIAAIRRRPQVAGRALELGIGDDCALVRPGLDEEIAVTTDLSLEQVHFRRDWHPAESVGHRCLARGLSDLAAMGARPLAAFLSLATPRELMIPDRSGKSWVDRFLDGLMALAAEWKVPLAGGDTAQSPPGLGNHGKQPGRVAADIVLVGGVAKGRALLRSRAKAGDIVYVTGALGGAAAELLSLERNPKAFRRLSSAVPRHPHFYPEPRVGVGRKLITGRLASAAIDLSDGLSTDLRHVCEESGLAAEIDGSAIPVHPLAREAEAAGWADALRLALNGGEDYELLFTSPVRKRIPSSLAGVPIHAIGRITPQRRGRPTIELLEASGKGTRRIPLEAGGWEHFG